MKKYPNPFAGMVILFMLLTGFNLCGQIDLKLEINHKNFHQYEPIFARVTFLNRTGRLIAFSDSEMNKGGRLTFLIEDAADNIISIREDVALPVNGLILRNGAIEKMLYCISKYYNISELGKYRIKAIIEHPQVTGKWESNTVTFTVGSGSTVWEQLVGVPDPDNKMKNKLRKYVIKSFYDGKDKIFYLIIEDKEMIYSVIRIGYDVGTSKPDCLVDSQNRLNIILQASPNIFSHFIYSYTGQRENKEVYQKSDTSPRLVADPVNGDVKVVGGKKALKDLQYKEDPGTIFGK